MDSGSRGSEPGVLGQGLKHATTGHLISLFRSWLVFFYVLFFKVFVYKHMKLF
ncbi:hypothetical protein HanRHA438_Chr17g0805391 [Helianthus annuus]|nr:hypothetical protein HanRHA438_Chr17g0805391 [Helianthus annuus]